METKALWDACVKFHGHVCPGLAIGFRAVLAGFSYLGLDPAEADEEQVVCVAESDFCGIDAVMALSCCTVGKGNLVLRNSGKMAFSFFDRDAGTSVRLIIKPDVLQMPREEKLAYLLEAPEEALFLQKAPKYSMPEAAVVRKTVVCQMCGEPVMDAKTFSDGGRTVCSDCYHGFARW